MKRPLKILVAGYLIGFPLGGMAWMLMHYLAGLVRLGHEVVFIEDSSTWSYPFDPVTRTYGTDSTYGRQCLARLFAHFRINPRWAYYSFFEDRIYGMTWEEMDDFCDQADLLLNISGLIPKRDTYWRCRVKALIDTDPVFFQIKGADTEKPWVLDYYKSHDHFFTYGYNLPQGKTPVPLLGLDWKPLLPPIITSEWEPVDSPGTIYTTIGSWETKDRDIELAGERYSWRKSTEYEKILYLPRKVPPGVGFELAYSGMEEDRAKYEHFGWRIRHGYTVSTDFLDYRDYIRHSRGEFTVAKDQNIRLRSGWFSDRAVSYLASGRPVITQDTGFTTYLPTGEGLFAFQDMDDILAAIRDLEADQPRHRAAARRIAQEHFEAEKVLTGMLKEMDLA